MMPILDRRETPLELRRWPRQAAVRLSLATATRRRFRYPLPRWNGKQEILEGTLFAEEREKILTKRSPARSPGLVRVRSTANRALPFLPQLQRDVDHPGGPDPRRVTDSDDGS